MPCVDNKDLIYNIKELPETFSIASGDLLLVENDEGTNIMNFDNLIIGLDNTTFGTTITTHSTDINTLSADVVTLSAAQDTLSTAVAAAVAGVNTTALVNVTAQSQEGISLVASNNISSFVWDSNVIRLNFTTNLPNSNYMVLPSAAVENSTELVQFTVIDKQTNYVDLEATNILTGSVATAATGIGFSIQTF